MNGKKIEMFDSTVLIDSFDFIKSLGRKKGLEWVEALRSKKYKQCRGSLKSRGKFCCLGVLGDIDENISWTKNSIVIGDDIYTDILPNMSEVGQSLLTGLNDDQRASFDDIAHFIELAVRSKTMESFRNKLEDSDIFKLY